MNDENKQTHRYGEETTGCQWRKDVGEGHNR